MQWKDISSETLTIIMIPAIMIMTIDAKHYFSKKKNCYFHKNNVTEEHRDPSFLQEL